MHTTVRTRVEAWPWLCLVVLLVIVVYWSMPLRAATHSITYTAGQDTAIQNQVIPVYNRAHCAAFGRPTNCTSADLVASGCVARVVNTLTVDSCTIFPSTLAGEAAFLQEAANRFVVQTFDRRREFGAVDYRAAFESATQTAKDNACTALGLPAGCPGP